MLDTIPWERALIRSGFRFTPKGAQLNVAVETIENREYLTRILSAIGEAAAMKDAEFEPKAKSVLESDWLLAIEKLHGGAEGGRANELPIMDTYMAGIVRTVNELGIATSYSCDGHDKKDPVLHVSDRLDEFAVNAALQLISSGQWSLRNRVLRGMAGRHWLLDVAEKLYALKDELRLFIAASRRLGKAARADFPRIEF